MAIAVQSVSTAAYSNSVNNVVITKPTGLAEDDLMVALIGWSDTAGVQTPSGWTEMYDADNLAGFWKIATSSDVAASNFTFTLEDLGNVGGCILRIDGHDPNDPIFDDHVGTQSSVSTSFSISHTMEDTGIANHILLMHVYGQDNTGGQPDISAPTVTGGTSPTFTQSQEFADGGFDIEWTSWYATKPDATVITAYGGTSDDPSSDGNTFIRARLMLLRPQTDATGTIPQTTANASLDVNLTTDTTVTIPQTTANATVNNVSGNGVSPTVWTPTAKS